MNAEHDQQAKDDASKIDSIALEALASETNSAAQLDAHSEYSAALSLARQAQTAGLNEQYVDGERIDEYCNSRQLDVVARLKLFKQVCEAVHSAHQHGIIHGAL